MAGPAVEQAAEPQPPAGAPPAPDAGPQPPIGYGPVADCTVSLTPHLRSNRMTVFQRGRSCRVHPYKDTGSRDGFLVLSERAVLALAAEVGRQWGSPVTLSRFHGLFRGEVAGSDPGPDQVSQSAVYSMFESSVKGVEEGAPDTSEWGGEVTPLQAVRTALVAPEGFLVDGRPAVEIAFVKVAALGPPGCGRRDGCLVSVDALGTYHAATLSAVAEAAGLDHAVVEQVEAATWGTQVPVETLEEQDLATRRVLFAAWPTARVIEPAPKLVKQGRNFRPCWPKLHWRMREACWSERQDGARVAVFPFTVAAMNNTGQPDHKPISSWLATAALVRVAPAGACPAPARAVHAAQPLGMRSSVAGVSPPFTMVSCNERPRCLASRNNRRLAFMPVQEGPGAAVDLDGPSGETTTLAFVEQVRALRAPARQELEALELATRAVVARATVLRMAGWRASSELRGAKELSTAASAAFRASIRVPRRRDGKGGAPAAAGGPPPGTVHPPALDLTNDPSWQAHARASASRAGQAAPLSSPRSQPPGLGHPGYLSAMPASSHPAGPAASVLSATGSVTAAAWGPGTLPPQYGPAPHGLDGGPGSVPGAFPPYQGMRAPPSHWMAMMHTARPPQLPYPAWEADPWAAMARFRAHGLPPGAPHPGTAGLSLRRDDSLGSMLSAQQAMASASAAFASMTAARPRGPLSAVPSVDGHDAGGAGQHAAGGEGGGSVVSYDPSARNGRWQPPGNGGGGGNSIGAGSAPFGPGRGPGTEGSQEWPGMTTARPSRLFQRRQG